MRKLKAGIGAILGVLLILWLGAGFLVWSRNRVPALNLAPLPQSPTGNVYDEYARCVAEMPMPDKQAMRVHNALNSLPAADQQAMVTRNRELLERFHKLPGRPSMVTSIIPDAKATGAVDYPYLAGLIALEGKGLAASNPDRALTVLLNGLTFAEDVFRGGAFIQLGAGSPSTTPLSRGFSAALPSFSAASANKGAQQIKTLLDKQYPLKDIMEMERRVRIQRVTAAPEQQAARIFRFQIPTDSFEWEYLLRPKSEAIAAFDTYLRAWVTESEKPISEIKPPELTDEAKKVASGELDDPGAFMGAILHYNYRITRLKLIYTALRLEQHRKTRGQYPASLADLGGSDPNEIDPFSGKPFVYRREGGRFVLYSVGMNGQDDGDAPEPSARGGISPNKPGDISFEPKLIFESRRGR